MSGRRSNPSRRVPPSPSLTRKISISMMLMPSAARTPRHLVDRSRPVDDMHHDLMDRGQDPFRLGRELLPDAPGVRKRLVEPVASLSERVLLRVRNTASRRSSPATIWVTLVMQMSVQTSSGPDATRVVSGIHPQRARAGRVSLPLPRPRSAPRPLPSDGECG